MERPLARGRLKRAMTYKKMREVQKRSVKARRGVSAAAGESKRTSGNGESRRLADGDGGVDSPNIGSAEMT